MIRSILKLGVILVVGILVYNFFLGNEVEKENSRKIFNEIKDVGVAVKDLLKTEKEKFDEGKYDEALGKIEGVFSNLKEKAKRIEDQDLLDKLARLEEKREELESEFKRKSRRDDVPDEFNEKGERKTELSEREQKQMKRELDQLIEETEEVMKEVEKQ